MKQFVLTVIIGLAIAFGLSYAPDADASADIDAETVKHVRDATYKLYVRISPPGRRYTQAFAFCSSSFYEHDTDDAGKEPGYYGTTAGHCLDAYSVLRQYLKERVFGLEFEIVIDVSGGDRSHFVTVEDVAHGFSDWRRWREEDDEDMKEYLRPELSEVQDWGLLRAPAEAEINTVDLVDDARKDYDDEDAKWHLDISTGANVYMSGYPWALGKVWYTGVATPDYRLPGTIFDHVLAGDYMSAPGTSGAPVVNADGEQVGIHVAHLPSGPSLATPITDVDFDDAGPVVTEGVRHPSMRYRKGHAMPLPQGVSFPDNMQDFVSRVTAFVQSMPVPDDGGQPAEQQPARNE